MEVNCSVRAVFHYGYLPHCLIMIRLPYSSRRLFCLPPFAGSLQSDLLLQDRVIDRRRWRVDLEYGRSVLDVCGCQRPLLVLGSYEYVGLSHSLGRDGGSDVRTWTPS